MALRAKTKRRVIILLSCIALLVFATGIAYLVRQHLLERRAQNNLAAGMKAFDEGDYPAALRGIGNYLSRHPNDVDHLLQYAQARVRVELPNHQELADGVSIYQRILTLQPNNRQAEQSLLDLYETIHYDVEAIQLSSQMLQQDPSDAAVLKDQAISYFRQRKFADAATAALAYNQANPDDLPAQVFTLQILVQTDGGSRKVLDRAQQLRNAHPDDIRPLLLQSVACTLTQDNAGAVSWLKQALSQNPPDAQTVLVLVSQCDTLALASDVASSDSVDLENQALRLLQTQAGHLNDPALSATLASRLWQLDRFQDVIDHFPTAKKDDPVELQAMRCLSLHSLGRDADATAAAAILQQAAHDHPQAKPWASIINQILSAGPANDGDTIAVCRTALNEEPANAYFHFFLGEAYAHVDEPDAAVRQWQSAAQFAPSWAAPTMRVAELMLNSGRFDDALAAASLAVRRSPQSRAAQVTLLAAKVALLHPQDMAAADELLGELKNLPAAQGPGDSDVTPLCAEVQLRAGRRDAAVQIIQAAIAANPPPPASTLLRLAALSELANLGLDDQCFAAATHAYGVTPDIALAHALALWHAGKTQEGLELLRSARATSVNGNSSPSKIESWDIAWARYLDTIADPGARQAWIDLAAAHDKEVAVQWMALNAHSVKWDKPFVGLILDRLKAQLGDQGVEWRLARARYLLDQSPSDDDRLEAALLLTGITQEEPNLLEARLLLANCRYEMHDTVRAIEQLTKAAEIAPQNADIDLDLARMLQETGDFATARKYTDRVMQLPLSPAQRSAAANLMSNEGDRAGAIAMLESLPATTQPSTADQSRQLMLARLYFQTGQKDKLQELCRQLLANPDPQALALVSEVYAVAGRQSESVALLKQLDGMQIAPDLKAMILGSHAIRLGRIPAAAEYFRQATIANPANIQAWRALIQSQLQLLSPDAALASARSAATKFPQDDGFAAAVNVLSASGSLLPRWPELSTMISALLSATPQELDAQTPAVQEVCQTITQCESSHAPVKQWVDTLSNLADKYPQLCGLQVLAGRLELAVGNADRAAALATRAMQAFPSDPGSAALAARAWAVDGQWSESLQAAQQWHDRAPDLQLAANEVMAEAQTHLNNLDDAYAHLQPYLDRAKADPNHFGDLLLQVADIQIKRGHPDQAAELLQPLLANSSPARLDWIKLASTMDSPDAVAHWLNQVEPSIPADAVAERLALTEQWQLLAARTNSDEYRRKATDLTKQFAQQCAAHADAGELLMFGGIQESQDDADGAQASYRAALRLQPNMVVAQNNLAMILARSNHLDEALVYAKQAAQAEGPFQADCQQTLAYVLDHLGRQKDAIDALNSALKISPNHIPSLIELSGIYAATGQLDQARAILQQLQQIAPDPKSLSPEQQAKLASLQQTLSQ